LIVFSQAKRRLLVGKNFLYSKKTHGGHTIAGSNNPVIIEISGAHSNLIPTSAHNKPQDPTTIMLLEKCLFPLYPGSNEGRILVSSQQEDPSQF